MKSRDMQKNPVPLNKKTSTHNSTKKSVILEKTSP